MSNIHRIKHIIELLLLLFLFSPSWALITPGWMSKSVKILQIPAAPLPLACQLPGGAPFDV